MSLVRKSDKTNDVISRSDDEFKIPTHRAPRKKKILDEEIYVKKLENIVERDFFPNLENLKDKLDYLEAFESNDIELMQEIQAKYTEIATPTVSNIRDSPATFDTPITVAGADKTGHKTPLRETGVDDLPRTFIVKSSSDNENKLPSLDNFMASYSSEDNESFEQVLDDQNKLFRIKHPWLFEAEGKHNANYTPNLALPSIETQKQQKILSLTGTSDKDKDIRPLSVENWKYKTFNSVMYVPEGTPLSDNQRIEYSMIKKREIAHENTRYTENPFRETLSQAAMLEASAIQAYKKEGKVGIDGKEIKDSPKVNGYSYVRSPSPAPGVDCSPLMTWGRIDGTPFQLDGSQTPLIKMQAPSYSIPKVSARDELHLKLAEKVSQNHRDAKSAAKSKKFPSPAIRKTPGSNMERLSSISPAAQKLFSFKLGIHTTTDRSLRASYTPSPISRSSSVTPKVVHDNLTKYNKRSLANTPKRKSVATPSAEPVDLTDNLLQLPKRISSPIQIDPNVTTRKHAEDFF